MKKKRVIPTEEKLGNAHRCNQFTEVTGVLSLFALANNQYCTLRIFILKEYLIPLKILNILFPERKISEHSDLRARDERPVCKEWSVSEV